MSHRCTKQRFVGGLAFECCRPEFHRGPCNFLFVERAAAVAARQGGLPCNDCGGDHATHNCPEKVGGTE